jgi:hypothetical protein
MVAMWILVPIIALAQYEENPVLKRDVREVQNRVDVIEMRVGALESPPDVIGGLGKGPISHVDSDGIIGVWRQDGNVFLFDAYGLANSLREIPFWVEQKDVNEVYVTEGVLYVRGMTNVIVEANNVAWATNTITITAASRLMMKLDFANNTYTFTNVVGSGGTLPDVPAGDATIYYWGVADIDWDNGNSRIDGITRNQLGAIQIWH